MALDVRAMLNHLEQRREMNEVGVVGRPRPSPVAAATLGIGTSITLTAVLPDGDGQQMHDSRARPSCPGSGYRQHYCCGTSVTISLTTCFATFGCYGNQSKAGSADSRGLRPKPGDGVPVGTAVFGGVRCWHTRPGVTR
jgi:hypothetical protein